jgi:WD40 repeat protein
MGLQERWTGKSRPAYQDAVPPQIFGADVTSVAIAPDSHYAAAAAGASVRMWEARSGRTIGEVPRSARVLSFHFLGAENCADGEYLGAGSSDGFTIWDCKTWTAVASDSGMYEYNHGMLGATFSAAGHAYLAYARREARVWTGQGISTVNRNNIGANIFAAAVSPDGVRLLAITDVGFEVWSLPVGTEGKRLARIGEAVKATGIALSPDGSKVAVVYDDGKTKVLSWSRKELIEETCRRLVAAADRFANEVTDSFDGPYHNYCRNPAAIGQPQ